MKIFLLVFLIIIILELVVFVLLASNIEIDIINCDLSYTENSLDQFKLKKINLTIKISFLGKFLIFACFIDENNINFWKLKFKHKFSGNLETDILTGINKMRDLVNRYEKYSVEYLKPSLDELDIYAAIGMPEHMMTVFALPIFACYLSFKFREYINKYNVSKYNYEVIPRYLNKMYFKMILNVKIKIKFLNLIKFLFMIKSKK